MRDDRLRNEIRRPCLINEYVSPLYTEVGTRCFTSVPFISLWQAVMLTPCWANAGPTLAQYWVTKSCLVSRSMWASVTDGGPTITQLVQSIVPVPPACRYHQHKVLTRAEWILASTDDNGPTFKRHWVGIGLYLPPPVSTDRPQPSKQEALNQC